MNENKTVYNFSDKELKYLTLFFRKHTFDIPKELKSLYFFAERYSYENMTKKEAESFFIT